VCIYLFIHVRKMDLCCLVRALLILQRYIECGCNTIANPSGCNRNPSFALRSVLFFMYHLVSTARLTKLVIGTISFPLTCFQIRKPSLAYAAVVRSAFRVS
jgi:hypothetical protein